jgi:hypothetical protein
MVLVRNLFLLNHKKAVVASRLPIPAAGRVEARPQQASRPKQPNQNNQSSFLDRKREKKKVPQTISLKEIVLKEQKREPSKNLEELRKLLGQIKPDTKEEKSTRESARPTLAEDGKHDTNEIPEPELRNMLRVSDSE